MCAPCVPTFSSCRARATPIMRATFIELGATDAVPETVEASLQLSEAALVGLGIPDRSGDRLDPRKARRNPP